MVYTEGLKAEEAGHSLVSSLSNPQIFIACDKIWGLERLDTRLAGHMVLYIIGEALDLKIAALPVSLC